MAVEGRVLVTNLCISCRKSASYLHKRSDTTIDSAMEEEYLVMFGTSRQEPLAWPGLAASVVWDPPARLGERYRPLFARRAVVPRLPALGARVNKVPALVLTDRAEPKGGLRVAFREQLDVELRFGHEAAHGTDRVVRDAHVGRHADDAPAVLERTLTVRASTPSDVTTGSMSPNHPDVTPCGVAVVDFFVFVGVRPSISLPVLDVPYGDADHLEPPQDGREQDPPAECPRPADAVAALLGHLDGVDDVLGHRVRPSVPLAVEDSLTVALDRLCIPHELGNSARRRKRAPLAQLVRHAVPPTEPAFAMDNSLAVAALVRHLELRQERDQAPGAAGFELFGPEVGNRARPLVGER